MRRLFIILILLFGGVVIFSFIRSVSSRPKGSLGTMTETSGNLTAAVESLRYAAAGEGSSTTRVALIDLIKQPSRALLPSKIGTLTAQEEAQLLTTYRNSTNLFGRFGIAHALACGGGDESFKMFKYTLEEEFRGKPLSSEDEGIVLLTARLLGLLAPRSDTAWEYLKAGCFPQYWATIQKWKGTRLDTDSYLADYCIQGVGSVGTAEARTFLEQLKNRLTRDEARDVYGAVLSAAGQLDIAEEQGRVKFLDEIFMREPQEYDFYTKWKMSEKAKPWLEWRDKVKQNP